MLSLMLSNEYEDDSSSQISSSSYLVICYRGLSVYNVNCIKCEA